MSWWIARKGSPDTTLMGGRAVAVAQSEAQPRRWAPSTGAQEPTLSFALSLDGCATRYTPRSGSATLAKVVAALV